jgi:hypothetical protein
MAASAPDAAGVEWEMGTDGGTLSAIEGMAAAGLVVTARLADLLPPGMAPVDARAGLPALPRISICLRLAPARGVEVGRALVDSLRRALAEGTRVAA